MCGGGVGLGRGRGGGVRGKCGGVYWWSEWLVCGGRVGWETVVVCELDLTTAFRGINRTTLFELLAKHGAPDALTPVLVAELGDSIVRPSIDRISMDEVA